MNIVEITYRYEGDVASTPERPGDAEAALRRLNDGSRAFADLFANPDAQAGTARRIIHIDPRDLGLRHGQRVAAPATAVCGGPRVFGRPGPHRTDFQRRAQ